VDLHPRDPSSTVESFVPFRDRVVLFESRKTFRQARVIEADGTIRALKLSGKQLANLAPVDNVDYHSSRLRYRQETYLEPESVREYDFATGKIDVLTTTPVDPSYDPSLYVETRVFAKAADGKEIPITLVRRKEVTLGMSTPLYVDSYGNYGMVFPADFSVGLASLLDRGVVYAWIHTRGSSDMGYAAYVDGKLMNKLNTFTDFVTGLKHLHKLGLSSPNRTAVSSLSAGGLLIGYLVNNYPTLAKAYIANVPFVDLISTMKDETIPLTAQEWLEWGNPRVRAEYEYMLGYSPYDQVPYGDAPKRQYPALFVTTALNDYAVFYWEPLKWVAKMRNNAINPESIVLRVWEDSGHGDGFSPLAQLNRPATNYAFALWQLGIRD
jgi:oligopeptidase B